MFKCQLDHTCPTSSLNAGESFTAAAIGRTIIVVSYHLKLHVLNIEEVSQIYHFPRKDSPGHIFIYF